MSRGKNSWLTKGGRAEPVGGGGCFGRHGAGGGVAGRRAGPGEAIRAGALCHGRPVGLAFLSTVWAAVHRAGRRERPVIRGSRPDVAPFAQDAIDRRFHGVG